MPLFKKLSAKLIDFDSARRQLFFANRGIDTGVKLARELAKVAPEYLEIKKALGSRNFNEALRKVSEAWKGFAELLKERRQGRLPPWLNPRPRAAGRKAASAFP
jgi:hypothetical protein